MDCRYSRRRIKDETDLVVCVVLWRVRVSDSWGGDPVVINIISLSGYREDPPEMERILILEQRSIGNARSTYQVAFRGGLKYHGGDILIINDTTVDEALGIDHANGDK